MRDERILWLATFLGNLVAQLFITTFYITTRADVSPSSRGLLLWTIRNVFYTPRKRGALLPGFWAIRRGSTLNLRLHVTRQGNTSPLLVARVHRSLMNLGNCIIMRRLVNDDGITVFEIIARSNMLLLYMLLFSRIKKRDSLSRWRKSDDVRMVRIHIFLA